MDSFACSFELILTDKFYIGENNASKMQSNLFNITQQSKDE